MNYRHATLALLLPLTLIVACKADTPAASGASVATVNGQPVSQSEFDLYVENVARQSQRQVQEADKPQLLDQFISMKLAAAAAEKDGIAKDPKVSDQLALARLNVLVDVGLQKWLEGNPVRDEELRPEYDAQVAQMPREYHARHILVGDKALADSLTQQLKGGADFTKLAAKNTKDELTKNDGDLGWLPLDAMLKPIADTVVTLQPGQLTDQPVQSEHGWHIVKLEESRASAAPPFEDVKDRIKVLVQRRKLQTYLEDLRKNAKVEKKI